MDVTRRLNLLTLILVFAGLFGSGANAVTDSSRIIETLPGSLQPWVDWVLEDKPEAGCTHSHDGTGILVCSWPGLLQLDLDAHGGEFSQHWSVEAPTWVPLPGIRQYWPVDVSVNGESALLTDRNGFPVMLLEAGEYDIEGSFNWSSMPARLAVPQESGIVQLKVSGTDVINPLRDEMGRIQLSTGVSGARSNPANRIEIAVFRRLIDSVPFRIQTRLVLDVSGAEREVVLPNIFLPETRPLVLTGPLPIRLLSDGRIQLQLRPGHFEFELGSRFEGNVSQIGRGAIEVPLPAQEVWSFEAQGHLREVRLEGLPSVDPRQTRMPDKWHHLPAYLVGPDAILSLEVKRRGVEIQPTDQLRLTRELWLDFDGDNYTFQDKLLGTAYGDGRLEVETPVALGQVLLNGEPQFITRLEERTSHGVEIRPGRIDMVADARLEAAPDGLPVSGWNRELRNVETVLHLPPGWRLLAATGVDRVNGAWLDRWSMLDMFLVLVLSIATFRMWGVVAGLAGFTALVLIWQSPGAPQYVWIPLILTTALLNVLKPGRLKQWFSSLRIFSIVAVLVVAAPFLIQTARTVMYPQLEQRTQQPIPPTLLRQKAFETSVLQEQMMADAEAPPSPAKQKSGMALGARQMVSSMEAPARRISTARIQTGPGVPEWRWHRYQLQWNGPVGRAQEYGLMLLPPPVNRALGVMRFLLLVGLFAIMVLNRPVRFGHKIAASLLPLFVTGLVAFTVSNSAGANSFPPMELLEDLKERLVQPPDCVPHCASIHRARVESRDDYIQILLEVTALDDIALPLPQSSSEWTANMVRLDNQPASVRGGKAGESIRVPRGRHRVWISGPVGEVDEIQLSFPLRPHQLEVDAGDWTASGMERAGANDRQLRLRRSRKTASTDKTSAEPVALIVPFLEVTRTLIVGLDVRVANRLRRLSDSRGAVAVDIPLLSGESPVSAGVRVADGAVRATFAAGQEIFQWESFLDLTSPLVLTAPEQSNWVERWRLDADTRWHVRHAGLNPILGDGGATRAWQPWPGERLELTLQRPDGVEGDTLTLDRTRLLLVPGQRSTRGELTLQMRSSQGGVHGISLPRNARVQRLKVDGRPQPVEPDETELSIALTPGARRVEVEWLQAEGMDAVFTTPTIDLKMPSVNSTIQIEPEKSRWLIWLHGPVLGPAILYWGLLLFLLIASLALSKFRNLPLKWWQWFLLGVGLSHGPIWTGAIVVGWFALLSVRRGLSDSASKSVFNLGQLAIGGLTPVMLIVLVEAVRGGLLGSPDMQIAGNGSSATLLSWFQDRSPGVLPEAFVLSVPLLAYRLLMLVWSLWLAFSLLRWLRWGWESFSDGGIWRPIEWRKRKQKNSV